MKMKPIAAAWLTPAAAFLLSAGLWTLALKLFGFYPFGGHSILITDMGQQYIEFHTALYDAVHNGGSLFYTWDTGMGMNFMGLFAYYLSSPFTLLMFFFPRSAIPEALLVIISLKIASSGLTFSVFLRRAAGVRGITNILFSVLYALSAYMVVFFFDIMWLDAVVLLPLVILAVRHAVDTRKIAPLTAALAVLFFSNFYTAYMVGLFSFLVLIALLWIKSVPKRDCIRIAGLFFGAAALAAGLTAFLMLPTFLALKDSQGGAAGEWPFLGFNTDPLTLLGKFSWSSYDSVTDSGTANLYCGVLALGLMPVWLLHRRISRREKIAGSALLGILFFSLLFCPLDVLWQACEIPVWFPSRYSFVVIFTVLTFAARALSRRDGLTARRIFAGFFIAATLMIVIEIPEWFSPKSCHTMTGSLPVTLLALAVYAVLLLVFILRKRRWLRGVGFVLLLICVSAEAVGNATDSFKSLDKELRFQSRDSYTDYITRGDELMTTLNTYAEAANDEFSDTNFYRVENSNASNANDGLVGGYPAISHYSSFSRRDTFSFLKNCGMVCTVSNKVFRYYGSTSALDALLGIRYVYSSNEFRNGYFATVTGVDSLTLYQNEYALPLAVFADQSMQDLPADEDTPFDLMNTFLSSCDGITNEYYSPLFVASNCTNGVLEQKDERTLITADKNKAAVLRFTIYNTKSQDVQLYLDNNLAENTAVYLNGDLLNPQGERLIRGVIDLGEQPIGPLVISMYVSGDTHWFSNLHAMSFDEAAFEELNTSLRRNAPKDLTISQTSFGEPLVTGHITAPRDGTIFTSIPADGGWAAYIDGKKVKTVAAGGAFLTIPITEGEHFFTLHYRPRGLTAGICISVAAAAFCVFLWLFRRRKRRNTSESATCKDEPDPDRSPD